MILLVGKMAHTSSMQDPFLASDGEEIQEPNRKVPDAPRISDEFMVMPSFTTAAEQGQRSSTPDVTSQTPNPDKGLQVKTAPLHVEGHVRLPCALLVTHITIACWREGPLGGEFCNSTPTSPALKR